MCGGGGGSVQPSSVSQQVKSHICSLKPAPPLPTTPCPGLAAQKAPLRAPQGALLRDTNLEQCPCSDLFAIALLSIPSYASAKPSTFEDGVRWGGVGSPKVHRGQLGTTDGSPGSAIGVRWARSISGRDRRGRGREGFFPILLRTSKDKRN